jgi:hypothetical protein
MATTDGEWTTLGDDLKRRFNEGCRNPAFILYFIFIILIIGITLISASWYLEKETVLKTKGYIFSHTNIVFGIASYFIGLLTAAAVDLILSTKGDSAKSFVMVGVGALLSGVALTLTSILSEHFTITRYFIAGLGCLLSWTVWWIANSENPNFKPAPNATDAVQGPPPVLPGNPQKFKV